MSQVPAPAKELLPRLTFPKSGIPTVDDRREWRRKHGIGILTPLGAPSVTPRTFGMSDMTRRAYERWVTARWQAAGAPELKDDEFFDPDTRTVLSAKT